MDWKTIGNYVLLIGLILAIFKASSDINTRIDGRFDILNERLDRIQAETNARFDTVLEAIRSVDSRVSNLEGRLDGQSADK